MERIARVGVTGVNNVHRIKKWIGQYISVYLSISQYILYFPTEEANLDPNDPRNWELLELVEVRERRGGGGGEREKERDVQYIFCVFSFSLSPVHKRTISIFVWISLMMTLVSLMKKNIKTIVVLHY